MWRLQRLVFRATVAHATARSKGTNMQALAKVELLQGLSEDQLHKVGRGGAAALSHARETRRDSSVEAGRRSRA